MLFFHLQPNALVVNQPNPCRQPKQGVSSIRPLCPDASTGILCGHFSDEPPLLMPKPDGNDENVHRHRRSKSGVSIHRAGQSGRGRKAYTRSIFGQIHPFRSATTFIASIVHCTPSLTQSDNRQSRSASSRCERGPISNQNQGVSSIVPVSPDAPMTVLRSRFSGKSHFLTHRDPKIPVP